MRMGRSLGKEKGRGGIEMAIQLTIDVTEEGLGCTATCCEIPQLYGYGQTPDEARAMFWREVRSMWEDLGRSDNFSQEFFWSLRFN